MDPPTSLTCEPCGGAPRVLHADVYGEGADLVECEACGYRWWIWRRPMPVGHFDFYRSPAYDRYVQRHLDQGTPCLSPVHEPTVYREAERGVARHLLEVAADILGRPIQRLYEVGCAWGPHLTVAREMGVSEIGGCDLSPANITEAARRGFTVEDALFQVSRFPGGRDAITMNAMIEHTTTPRADLCRAYEHLAPGGVVIVRTYYDEWHEEPGRWDPAPGTKARGYRGPVAHPSAFTSACLRALMVACGFREAAVEWERTHGQFTIWGQRPWP